MSSTRLPETEEDVFDLTDVVPETERLDSSLQKAKAQLSIKTRRHRPSRSRLRDSLSSTEGDDSLDGKSCSGPVSTTCSPLHMPLRCPSPISDLHSSSSPARKDRTFTFEVTEREKKEQRRRSACLLNSSSPSLLKTDHLQQHQENHAPTFHIAHHPQHPENHTPTFHIAHHPQHQDDSLQLWQRDDLKLHNKENFHLSQEDHGNLHQDDCLVAHREGYTHLHQKDRTPPKQSGHMQHEQEKPILSNQRKHLQKDHTPLQKRDPLQKDHLRQKDHLQEDLIPLQIKDHLQRDETHLQKRDLVNEGQTNLHNRDNFQTDHTQKDPEENRSPLHMREYSQSEDDARDMGSDEPSSPTVLLDKKTRRRFLDLGVTLRRTYGKVRRERASRHAEENREQDRAENRSSRSSGPPFVPFSWLTERIRGSGSPKNSNQSPAKSLPEDEELKNDSRSIRKESSQPYQNLSDHSDEGCDESAEPCIVKKKSILPFSSGGRDRTEKQNGVRGDKWDDGHDEEGQKLLTSQCKHLNR